MSQPPKKKRRRHHNRRPPTAYQIFCRQRHAALQDLSFSERSQKISSEWRQLSPEQKLPLQQASEKQQFPYKPNRRDRRPTPYIRYLQELYREEGRKKKNGQPSQTFTQLMQNNGWSTLSTEQKESYRLPKIETLGSDFSDF